MCQKPKNRLKNIKELAQHTHSDATSTTTYRLGAVFPPLPGNSVHAWNLDALKKMLLALFFLCCHSTALSKCKNRSSTFFYNLSNEVMAWGASESN